MKDEQLPALSVEELLGQVNDTMDSIQAEIDAFDERVAMQTPDDGKTTTERALDALKREERFRGEHEVAKAWLSEYTTLERARRNLKRRYER